MLRAAIALAVLLSPLAASAQDWAAHLDVEAASTADGQVRVVFQGKDGWYVNTAYPGISIQLTAPEGVTLSAAKAGKGEVVFEEPHPGGKARRAVFEVPLQGGSDAAVTGEYKIVVCSADSCSPPFRGRFEAPFPGEGR